MGLSSRLIEIRNHFLSPSPLARLFHSHLCSPASVTQMLTNMALFTQRNAPGSTHSLIWKCTCRLREEEEQEAFGGL